MWRRQTGRLCRLSFDGEHMTAHTGQNNGSNRKTFLLLLPLFCPVFGTGHFSLFCGFDSVVFAGKASGIAFIFFLCGNTQAGQFSVSVFIRLFIIPDSIQVNGALCIPVTQIAAEQFFAVCRLCIRSPAVPKQPHPLSLIKEGFFCFIIFQSECFIYVKHICAFPGGIFCVSGNVPGIKFRGR